MTEMVQHVARRAAFFCDSSPRAGDLLYGYNYRGEKVAWTDRYFWRGHPYASINRAIYELHPRELGFYQYGYHTEKFIDLQQTLSCALASGLGVAPRALWPAYVRGAITFDDVKSDLIALARDDNYDNLTEWLCGPCGRAATGCPRSGGC